MGPKSGQKRKQVTKDDEDDSESNKTQGRTIEVGRKRTTMSAEKGKDNARNDVLDSREVDSGQRAEERDSDGGPQSEPLDVVMTSEMDYNMGPSDIPELHHTISSRAASAFVNGEDKPRHTMPPACPIDSGPDSAIDMFFWPADDDLDFSLMLPTPDEIMTPDHFTPPSLPPGELDALARPQAMSVKDHGVKQDSVSLGITNAGDKNQYDSSLVEISTFTSKLQSAAPAIPTPPSTSSHSRATSSSSGPASHSSEASQKPRAVGIQAQSPNSGRRQTCNCLGIIADLLDKHEAEKDNASTSGVDDWLASLKESIKYLNDMLVCAQCVRKPENMTILMFLADSILSSCEGHVNQYLLQQLTIDDGSIKRKQNNGTAAAVHPRAAPHAECEGGGGSLPIYFGSYAVDSGSPMLETLVRTMILWHLRELLACMTLMKTASATSAGEDPERFSKCFRKATATQVRIASLVNQLTPLSLLHATTGEPMTSYLA